MCIKSEAFMRNIITDVFVEETWNYFFLLGGSGCYPGYTDWKPALLTLACAYEVTGAATHEELEPFWYQLDYNILLKCGGLRDKTLQLLSQNLEPGINPHIFVADAFMEISEILHRSIDEEEAEKFKQAFERAIKELPQLQVRDEFNVPKSKIDLRQAIFTPEVSNVVTQDTINYCCQLYKLDHFGDHGFIHWMRVLFNGRLLASKTGANLKIVELFCLLHDTHRHDEWSDPEHGARAADFVAELFSQPNNPFKVQLSDKELSILLRALRYHTGGMPSQSNGVTIGTCWDADRLDIDRVGLYPKAKYLSTKHARNHDVIEAAVLRSHMNPDIRF